MVFMATDVQPVIIGRIPYDFLTLLKQPQYEPTPLGNQVMIIYAVTNGYLDDVPVREIKPWENAFHRWIDANRPEIGAAIERDKELTDETEEALKAAIEEFKASGVA